ncbi:MAG TPA: acyltransferase family protein [Acidimicrobiales bacterium]|nr:acyltransferase family protein [Acidimicrobiales bacterium]
MVPRRTARRADIQGLRAVAIGVVVAYHTGLSVPGGYVGVDVFFVISGFLITQLLWKELGTTNRVSFSGFYARRMRRLLPAAVLTIVVTVAASAAWLPPLQARSVAKDGVASALYVANYRFAAQATNYLTAHGPVSPLQNFWSLGVEEQFYLVWPALLLVISLVWRARRRRGRHRRQAATGPRLGPAAAGLAVVGVGSFLLSLHLTKVDQPVAFFSLPTRAWELAAGAMLALLLPALRRVPGVAAAVVGWLGLAAIFYASFHFDAATPFPGTAALVPVLGAAAVLAAGATAGRLGPGVVLGLRPMIVIGGLSYTWYLWHWPALVLAPDALGHPLTLPADVVVSLASLVLALLTTVFVEQPVRMARWLAGRDARSLLLGAGISLAGALSAVLIVAQVPPPVGSGRAVAVGKLSTDHNAGHGTRPRAADARSANSTAAVLSATADQSAALNEQVNSQVAQSVTVDEVPSDLQPALADAASDLPAPEVDGCFDTFVDVTVHPCDYGDVSSPHSVVLFGDSHALMWFPAIDNIANQDHWHLVAMAKATCPPIDIPVFSPDLDEWYTQCDQWKAAEIQRMETLRPQVVILGFSREYGIDNDHVVVDGTAWMQGLSEMIHTLRALGARVVLMGDAPYPPSSVPDCLSSNLSDATACLIPKHYPAYNPGGIPQERAVATSAGAGYVDTDPWFCTADICTVMVGNLLVYRDDNHITATYANWLTPAIAAQLKLATRGVL